MLCLEGKTHFLANKGMKRGTEYAGYLFMIIYDLSFIFPNIALDYLRTVFRFITILWLVIILLSSVALASHSRGKMNFAYVE